VMEVRKIRVRSRLAKLAFAGGGMSVQKALANAESAIEASRPSSLIELDLCLTEIHKMFGPTVLDRGDRDLEDLYRLSSRIIDVSHALPSSGIEQAAWALCALADGCSQRGVKDWPAIDVHLQAISLLRTSGASLPQAAKAAILEGLSRVTLKRVGEDPSDGAPASGAPGPNGPAPLM